MEGLIVDGVVDEDVLFLVDSEEVAAVTVLDNLAVGNLDVFQDLDLVVYDSEHLKARAETHRQEKTAGVNRHCQRLLIEGVTDESFLLVPFDVEEVPDLDTVVLGAAGKQLFSHCCRKRVDLLVVEPAGEKLVQGGDVSVNPECVQVVKVE